MSSIRFDCVPRRLQGFNLNVMLRLAPNLLRRPSSRTPAPSPSSLNFVRNTFPQRQQGDYLFQKRYFSGGSKGSSPSLSIWRRRKEMGKEGLIAAKELKRLRSHPLRLDQFLRSNVSRLLKSDLVAVLAEFQRQDQVFLSMKVCFIF